LVSTVLQLPLLGRRVAMIEVTRLRPKS
jgi:hypothetical protein